MRLAREIGPADRRGVGRGANRSMNSGEAGIDR